ncbi:hypothetical protein DSO57_1032595 [Entomophthora muscae]|uniref:Uncharacterized protein n=1 Tax=Entomophthora muscae TaxID=34485 RepID=A0ACC2U9C3_9FUNG|nr:hypothetical protein DSO57_1032595 [Entomophthora muscae]
MMSQFSLLGMMISTLVMCYSLTLGTPSVGATPTTFSQVIGAANDHTGLFPFQKVAKMFTKMALNALSSSQSSNDPQLPPCDSLAYKLIIVLSV